MPRASSFWQGVFRDAVPSFVRAHGVLAVGARRGSREIDPHFGTNAELNGLIQDAHARGMKVFFDIITNHTADVISCGLHLRGAVRLTTGVARRAPSDLTALDDGT